MKSIILSTTALVLSAGVAFADTTVRMGTEGAYAPYNFINDDGEVDGFERELGDALCEAAELKCEWVTNEWDSIIPNLVSGNYDTIIAGMSITDERDEVIDFTQAYIPPEASRYIGLSEDADIDGVVASQTSTIQSAYVAESGATLLEYATGDELIAALRSGEADSVFFQGSFLEPIVEENADIVWVGEPVPLGGGVAMGIRESDAELKAKFDAAIETMKADGSLNTLISKWFGEGAQTF
ncbi:amino acid ABC transporter substrate-binding protein, PAAT family [Epibacterium ulvae]|uniref:Amino acid ABC transporter substrate-binding protein, PAAT family n=1 Tax=Epibacterium ulvae TaxID=1156985 RepID=A0A1G5Q039_9RHOB|nr:transporter substrate-binding domain-containing protein [Epibacterium ulvae]SCZ54761.1 amino acid ABC transporter substrate-binding protein, PAAT family [Epibacterium ulvae]